MLSAYSAFQQISSYSVYQASSDTNQTEDAPPPPPPPPANADEAVERFSDDANQSFEQTTSQLLEIFMDSLEDMTAVSEGGTELDDGVYDLSALLDIDYSSFMIGSMQFGSDDGYSSNVISIAQSNMSLNATIENGILTGVSLDFSMAATSLVMNHTTGVPGSAENYSVGNTQSISIDYSFGEDEDGNFFSEVTYERSESSFMNYQALGYEIGPGVYATSMAFQAGTSSSENGTMRSEIDGAELMDEELTGKTSVQMQLESALEILKSISESLFDDEETSLFSDNYYIDSDEDDEY